MKYYDVNVRITILADSPEDAEARVESMLFNHSEGLCWDIHGITDATQFEES